MDIRVKILNELIDTLITIKIIYKKKKEKQSSYNFPQESYNVRYY